MTPACTGFMFLLRRRSDAQWPCRNVLDATSQELVLTMAKLEETKYVCYRPVMHSLVD